jgi:hypothetical protein
VVKTSFSSAFLQNGMPWARQKARLHLLQEEPPLPAARALRMLLRVKPSAEVPLEDGE